MAASSLFPQLPVEIVEAIARHVIEPEPLRDPDVRYPYQDRSTKLPRNVRTAKYYMSRAKWVPRHRTEDITALRLTCRALEQKTFAAFATACFGALRTDLSATSVQALAALARDHPRLRPHVRALHVTHRLRDGISGRFGTDRNWLRRDHGDITGPRRDAFDALEAILPRFANCRTFYVHKDEAEQAPLEPDEVSVADVVAGLLAVVGRVRVPVVAFHLWPSPGETHTALPHAERLAALARVLDDGDGAWARDLERLSWIWGGSEVEVRVVGRLIAAAGNLRRLELRGSGTDINPLLRSMPPRGQGQGRGGCAGGLRELRLRCVYVDSGAVVDLLRLHGDSLRDVTLDRVTCEEGGLRTVIEALAKLEHLRGFSFYGIRETSMSGVPGCVEFLTLRGDATMDFFVWKQSDKFNKITLGVESSGPHVRTALQRILDEYHNLDPGGLIWGLPRPQLQVW